MEGVEEEMERRKKGRMLMTGRGREGDQYDEGESKRSQDGVRMVGCYCQSSEKRQ